VRSALKPGEKVQQDGVFGAFRAVPAAAEVPAIANYAVQDNPMGVRLRAAREALLGNGDLASAVEGLRTVMSWIGHVAEPWFLMGVTALVTGDRDTAGEWLAQRSAAQGRGQPELGLLDPCEIAWLQLLAYLTADDELFDQMVECAAGTSHVSLRRIAWLLAGASPVADLTAAGLEGPLPGDCLSIHWLGDEDFASWFGLVQRMLVANQPPMAQRA
jgi:hypothetical protein